MNVIETLIIHGTQFPLLMKVREKWKPFDSREPNEVVVLLAVL